MSEIFSPKERPAIKKGGLVLAMVLCASLLSACDCDGDCSTGVAQDASAGAGTTPSDGTSGTGGTGGTTTPTTTAPKCAAKDDTTKLTARFCKYDSTGTMLDDTATSWSCVEDTLLNNFWEVKTNDSGLRDRDWVYARTGTAGACGGTLTTCSPDAYVAAVNASTSRPCGSTRTCQIPTHAELIELAVPATYLPTFGKTITPGVPAGYLLDSRFFEVDAPASGLGAYFNASDNKVVQYGVPIPDGYNANTLTWIMAPDDTGTTAGQIRLICK
ncbi:hypothetical protein SAMN05660964_00044 [Thiothrix caldifontis]|uniref:Uncharacterized protein n=1 Tax=Thiothrix caldifontis TaxID=525918 RepID=A0A1H3VFJ1_9GAMM|nr:hypothetical protein [Thiothrix caldifontis]SDZ73519.1 hypothetical protein SAMN05660964_00044 [Thiothrix caldifontis]